MDTIEHTDWTLYGGDSWMEHNGSAGNQINWAAEQFEGDVIAINDITTWDATLVSSASFTEREVLAKINLAFHYGVTKSVILGDTISAVAATFNDDPLLSTFTIEGTKVGEIFPLGVLVSFSLAGDGQTTAEFSGAFEEHRTRFVNVFGDTEYGSDWSATPPSTINGYPVIDQSNITNFYVIANGSIRINVATFNDGDHYEEPELDLPYIEWQATSFGFQVD
ncbi:MAG: hypothetical protein EOP48_26615 [Sphingobacteriales bacterium]|nr:MAG: hypothetical protein EOP48_26615 [Sphingobacteriales bacterium]